MEGKNKISPKMVMRCAACLGDEADSIDINGTRIGESAPMKVTSIKRRPQGRKDQRRNTLY